MASTSAGGTRYKPLQALFGNVGMTHLIMTKRPCFGRRNAGKCSINVRQYHQEGVNVLRGENKMFTFLPMKLVWNWGKHCFECAQITGIVSRAKSTLKVCLI